MTTSEHKVKLFLEQNLHIPVLDYFDPMVFLQFSPVFVSEEMVELVTEGYLEKSRFLTLIDIYYLECLTKEVTIPNVALTRLFDKKEVSKKLRLFYTLYNVVEFSSMTGVAYFKRFPNGRVTYTK